MKYVFGCLAIVGLGTILFFAGCFAFIGLCVASHSKIPAYATKDNIEHSYKSDLSTIYKLLSAKSIDFKGKLSKDIIAIYWNDTEIYKKYKMKSQSYEISNGGGSGTLTIGAATYKCLVYEMEIDKNDYKVFIIDNHKDV
jgi:hypothetical protein